LFQGQLEFAEFFAPGCFSQNRVRWQNRFACLHLATRETTGSTGAVRANLRLL